MSADPQRQHALDRILASVREAADAALRSYADGVAEAATDELKRDTQAQTTQLRDTVQRLELTRIDLESQLAESRRVLAEVRASAEDEVAAARQSREAADAQMAETRCMLDATTRDAGIAAAAAAVELARANARAATARLLADSLRSLDDARSLGDALGRLVDAGARMADRVALFLVSDGTLSSCGTAGFDGAPVDASGFESACVVTVARRGARAVVQPRLDGRSDMLPPFAMSDRPRAAAACPVLIAGDVVAVLYADAPAAEDDGAPDWCDAIETVTRYAGRVLETLTMQLAVGGGTRPVQGSQAASGSRLSSGGVR